MIDQAVLITLLIVGAIILIATFVTMAVLLYHQMLLFNELNKRLLVKSMEDQEKYEGALAQLAEAEAELQRATDAVLQPKGPLDDSDEELHDTGIE